MSIKDPRVGSVCPHCGSSSTYGARTIEFLKDGTHRHVNTQCGDCGNGFITDNSTTEEAKSTLLDIILEKIDNKTITCEDIDQLIYESTPESIRDRIRRRTIKNVSHNHSNRDGHQSLSLPEFTKRITPKRKPIHQQNHGRSRLAHAHSTRTQRRNSHQYSEEISFVQNNIGKPINECDLSHIDTRKLMLVVTKMMAIPNINRDWLSDIRSRLEVQDG